MGRPNAKGYHLANLATMQASGKLFEFSAIPVADLHHLFFREVGSSCWRPVMTARKDGQLTYKTDALVALLERLATDFPAAPLQFRLGNRTFHHGKSGRDSPDHFAGLIESRYQALPANVQSALLVLLQIPPGSDPLWALMLAITYPNDQFDPLTNNLVANMLALPANWMTEQGSAA